MTARMPPIFAELHADFDRLNAGIDAELQRLWWSRVVDEFIAFAAIAGCLLAIVAVLLAGAST